MDRSAWVTLVAFLFVLPAMVLSILAFERRGNRTNNVPVATTTANPQATAEGVQLNVLQSRFPVIPQPTYKSVQGTNVASTNNFPVLSEALELYTVPAGNFACAFNWIRLVNPTQAAIGPVTVGLYAVTPDPNIVPLATFASIGADGGQQIVNTLSAIMNATDRLLLWAPPGLSFELTVMEWQALDSTDLPFRIDVDFGVGQDAKVRAPEGVSWGPWPYRLGARGLFNVIPNRGPVGSSSTSVGSVTIQQTSVSNKVTIPAGTSQSPGVTSIGIKRIGAGQEITVSSDIPVSEPVRSLLTNRISLDTVE